jgi:RNA polymerase sigma factor for flagellar operon FliA
MYLPAVKTSVGRMAMTLPSHVDEQHLYSAGLVGLLEAIRHFDAKVGANFESYARIRIRGAMLDELRRMDWAPRSVHAKARKIQQVIAELEQRHGRVPEDSEVAAALNLSVDEYATLIDEVRPATFICLDACGHDAAGDGYPTEVEGRGGRTEHEILGDANNDTADELVSRAELAALIEQRIQELPEFYRKVLALHYYEGLRVSEIAQATGFCKAHICQTHTKAILALRAFLDRHERNGPSSTPQASGLTGHVSRITPHASRINHPAP